VKAGQELKGDRRDMVSAAYKIPFVARGERAMEKEEGF